jgi:formylglycine-generating enzyme required for sulfatase activity
MGSLPSSSYLGDNKPVIYVSWDSITGSGGFLEKLNAQTGKNYRLPTEAEWEYAALGCNGGVCENFQYSGSDTVGDVAWHSNNCSILQPVGTKRANALGIYDMSGNVWECCSDWYSSSYYPSGTSQASPQDNPTGPASGSGRINRGGSWGSEDNNIYHRVAYRNNAPPGNSYAHDGFRLVLPVLP